MNPKKELPCSVWVEKLSPRADLASLVYDEEEAMEILEKKALMGASEPYFGVLIIRLLLFRVLY